MLCQYFGNDYNVIDVYSCKLKELKYIIDLVLYICRAVLEFHGYYIEYFLAIV